MTSLAIAVLAAAAGLALLAVSIELADRARDRRQRLRLERGRGTERLMWERLDWVRGPAPANPEPTVSRARVPAEPGSIDEKRAAAAREPANAPEESPIERSPRRLLWRDTSALLFVGLLGILAYSITATPGREPEGGVLGVTSSPAGLPQVATPASPLAAPTATPAPSQHASPRLRTESSPSPTPARTPRPSPSP